MDYWLLALPIVIGAAWMVSTPIFWHPEVSADGHHFTQGIVVTRWLKKLFGVGKKIEWKI